MTNLGASTDCVWGIEIDDDIMDEGFGDVDRAQSLSTNAPLPMP